MNKNEIRQIIFEEIKDALKEMASPEQIAAQSFIDDEELDDKRAADAEGEDFSLEDEMEMARDFNDEQDAIFGKPSFVEEEELSEMPRTSNVFKLSQNASMKDVLQFMQRVNDVLKTYKSPGQKRPKKRFTPEEMKALAVVMVQDGGFTSKDVIAATSYSSPAQANKFLKALEMKGLITLISQLKKAQEPTRDPNAPETRGRKRKDAEFDMVDDPSMMDFGDFSDLDLSDPLAESAASNLELKSIGKKIFAALKKLTQGQVKITYETFSFVPDPNADPNALGGGVKNYGVKSKNKTATAGFGWGTSQDSKPQIDIEIDERNKIPSLELKYGMINSEKIKFTNDAITNDFKDKIIPHPSHANTWIVRGSKGRDASGMAPGQRVDTKKPGRYTGQAISENKTTMTNLEKYIKQQIKEAKNPLAKKMKEIENQGRVAALETKLAAIAEMIEETEGRLTRIDEDNEFRDMMDKNAVKEVRKQLKELERAQAKLQKEYAKATGKKGYKAKEVMDEEKPFNEKTPEEMGSDDTKDLALSQAGIPKEVELEEDNFELNESVKRMQKLANLKG